MTNRMQKLEATISSVVESRQTGHDPLVVQHVRFLLRASNVQSVAKTV